MSGKEGTTGDEPPGAGSADNPARNMARIVRQSSQLLTRWLEEQSEKTADKGLLAAEDSVALGSLFDAAASLMSDPERLLRAQADLISRQMDLWQNALARTLGQEGPEDREADNDIPGPPDRRFSAREWQQGDVFDYLKQSYLLVSDWAQELLQESDALDVHERRRAIFFTRQLIDSLSPANFLLTNPQALHRVLTSKGENLVRGLEAFAADLERGDGQLLIRQSDEQAFDVGHNLATTAGKIVWRNELMELIQYGSTGKTVFRRPLLVVPPWINKYYILDLTPEKSLVRWAVQQGHTVFVISWVNPGPELRHKGFDNYMSEGILAALDAIEQATGESSVNAMGYCVGGTLLAATLAYMAAMDDGRIASATFMAAQTDFEEAGDLLVFIDEAQIAGIEADMAVHGFLPGRAMALTFNMLRDNDLIWSFYVRNYLLGEKPAAFDLLYWNADSTNLTEANHSFYMRQCYLHNNLAKGRMEVKGVRLDLKKITIPCYNLATEEDHIAPAISVCKMGHLFGGPVRFVLSGSGHIAGVINPPSQDKYHYRTSRRKPANLAAWRQAASRQSGSWWPDWQRWVARHGGGKVPARVPGGSVLPALDDAPGRYVKIRLD